MAKGLFRPTYTQTLNMGGLRMNYLVLAPTLLLFLKLIWNLYVPIEVFRRSALGFPSRAVSMMLLVDLVLWIPASLGCYVSSVTGWLLTACVFAYPLLLPIVFYVWLAVVSAVVWALKIDIQKNENGPAQSIRFF